MDEKYAKELLIKSGLSTKKSDEISGHLAREFNKAEKEKEVKEVVEKPKRTSKDIVEIIGGN